MLEPFSNGNSATHYKSSQRTVHWTPASDGETAGNNADDNHGEHPLVFAAARCSGGGGHVNSVCVKRVRVRKMESPHTGARMCASVCATAHRWNHGRSPSRAKQLIGNMAALHCVYIQIIAWKKEKIGWCWRL